MVLYDHRSIQVLYPRALVLATERVIKPTNLPNLPPENGELFLISELHKIKSPFSLFWQQAANFQVSTPSFERTLEIETYRINYVYQKMELQGNIAYLWNKKIIMILEHIQNFVATLIPGRKTDVENTTL